MTEAGCGVGPLIGHGKGWPLHCIVGDGLSPPGFLWSLTMCYLASLKFVINSLPEGRKARRSQHERRLPMGAAMAFKSILELIFAVGASILAGTLEG